VIGLVGATVVATILARRRGARGKALVLGDIEPLMPRNGAETFWTGLLSVNAGLGEELFFRLVLPLLIALVTGNTALAFVAAALVFGMVHSYQGWVGVLATTVLGLVFTGLYLASGALALPIAVHAGIDLMALVVRPTLARLAARP
jgi:membrane protease YdiL (CAAX protease family)